MRKPSFILDEPIRLLPPLLLLPPPLPLRLPLRLLLPLLLLLLDILLSRVHAKSSTIGVHAPLLEFPAPTILGFYMGTRAFGQPIERTS